jgi:hypothetical protein
VTNPYLRQLLRRRTGWFQLLVAISKGKNCQADRRRAQDEPECSIHAWC